MTPRRITPTCDPGVAIAYIRVSTEQQELGQESQRASIERWAAAQNVNIISWHTDAGVSGAANVEDCPELLKAIRAVEEKKAGKLVVARRDRVARDVVKAALVERLVERSGGKLISTNGEGAGDGPEDQLLRGIVDVFAQYERAIIRLRTKNAMAVKRARGERVGNVKYGYSLGPDGKTLVTNAKEQQNIQIMRELRQSGLSYPAIVRELEVRGISPRPDAPRKMKQPRVGPKRWAAAFVQRICGLDVPETARNSRKRRKSA